MCENCKNRGEVVVETYKKQFGSMPCPCCKGDSLAPKRKEQEDQCRKQIQRAMRAQERSEGLRYER